MDDCMSNSERQMFSLLGKVPPTKECPFGAVDSYRVSMDITDVVKNTTNSLIDIMIFDAMMARFKKSFNGKSKLPGGDILYIGDWSVQSDSDESGEH